MINSSIERELGELWKRLSLEYEKKCPRSKEMFERAKSALPGGVTYHIRHFKPYPLFIERAKGSRVWDVDGNGYDDYWMGHGAHILGHSPDFVVKSVNEVASKGTHLGYENPYALEYAELLTKIIPNLDLIKFTNSGTEANMYATRLARAYTKRKYVVKIEGGWHGGYDALHIGVTPPYAGPESLGLPEDFVKYTVVVPFNDLASLEEALRRYEVAAVIMEPVLGAGGCIAPEKGYLREVRRLVDEHGALLIFDEVITGFRLALGGGQEYFNVKADIVVLGKIVGGGYPGAGAFGGRAEVMELLDQVKRSKARERSFHGGTFTGNPVTITAGYTLVKYLVENKGLYDKFNETWSSAIKELDKLCDEYDRLCWVTGVGSMIGLHFTTERPINAKMAHEKRWSHKVLDVLHLYTRLNGILYMTEHSPHLLPSMVHDEEQRRRLIEVIRKFLDQLSRIVKAAK